MKSIRVPANLSLALRRAQPHADKLIAERGVHSRGIAEDATAIAQKLAGGSVSVSDEAIGHVVNVVEHAYILGIAVGLRFNPDAFKCGAR